MPIRSVTLTEHHDRFVDDEIMAGRYKDASDVLEASLRLLEKYEETKLLALREAIQEGLDDLEQGNYVELDSDELPGWLAGLGTVGRR